MVVAADMELGAEDGGGDSGRGDDEGMAGVLGDAEISLSLEEHLTACALEGGGEDETAVGTHEHLAAVGEDHAVGLAQGHGELDGLCLQTGCLEGAGGGGGASLPVLARGQDGGALVGLERHLTGLVVALQDGDICRHVGVVGGGTMGRHPPGASRHEEQGNGGGSPPAMLRTQRFHLCSSHFIVCISSAVTSCSERTSPLL